MFFHFLAWFLNDLFNWRTTSGPGFAVVSVLLFLLAALAAFIAYRLFKKGAPPTPDMAIEEAKAHARRARGADDRARPGQADAREGRGGEGVVASGSRSPEMIRASIEETRRELAFSVNDLRSKVAEITDWRAQLVRRTGKRR